MTGVAPDDTGALLNPRVFTIEDNTLIIQLLSVPLQSDQTTNDQLYRVIVDLVSVYDIGNSPVPPSPWRWGKESKGYQENVMSIIEVGYTKVVASLNDVTL